LFLRATYPSSLKNVSTCTFEKGAGSPSNNLVLVSHWYFEEASNALEVDGCTMKAFAITWGGITSTESQFGELLVFL